MIDLTQGVLSVVAQAGVENGLVSVFVPGSTAASSTMEYEPGGVHDLRRALERLVPARATTSTTGSTTTRTPTPTSGRRSSARRRPCRSGRPPGHRHLAAGGPDRLRRPPARAHGRRAGHLLGSSEDRSSGSSRVRDRYARQELSIEGIRRRLPSPAMVVALIALFSSLGGVLVRTCRGRSTAARSRTVTLRQGPGDRTRSAARWSRSPISARCRAPRFPAAAGDFAAVSTRACPFGTAGS